MSYVFFAPFSAVTVTAKVFLPYFNALLPVPDTTAFVSDAIALILILFPELLPNIYDVLLDKKPATVVPSTFKSFNVLSDDLAFVTVTFLVIAISFVSPEPLVISPTTLKVIVPSVVEVQDRLKLLFVLLPSLVTSACLDEHVAAPVPSILTFQAAVSDSVTVAVTEAPFSIELAFVLIVALGEANTILGINNKIVIISNLLFILNSFLFKYIFT